MTKINKTADVIKDLTKPLAEKAQKTISEVKEVVAEKVNVPTDAVKAKFCPNIISAESFKALNEVLSLSPKALMKANKADNILDNGISFLQATKQPFYNATRIEFGKTVKETIQLNKKNGIDIELVKDAEGKYFMGIKDIWTEGGYHRIDRNSAVMNYGKYTINEPYIDTKWALKNAINGEIKDCAVVANDEGAKILEKSYINREGKPIDFDKMLPNTFVTKGPAKVNAVAYDTPREFQTLEGKITTDVTMGDVEGNVYNNFKQLKKQITKGQLVANSNDMNSQAFINLIKEGKDDEALTLLRKCTK